MLWLNLPYFREEARLLAVLFHSTPTNQKDIHMFKELKPLLTKRSPVLTLSVVGDDQVRIAETLSPSMTVILSPSVFPQATSA